MNSDDINTEIQKLKQNRLLRSKSEFEGFEEALANLSEVTDNKIIKRLCEVFDDNTEDEEVMFQLIHLIEDFQGEDALIETAKAIPLMILQAKRWSKIIQYRILNDNPSRMIYINALRQVDTETREVVLNILKEMSNEDPKRFQIYVSEILANI